MQTRQWADFEISTLMLGTVQFGMSYGIANRAGQPDFDDVKAMVKAGREAGIAASVSQTAGTFVCNQVFYRLQHSLAGTGVRSGFIHVPYLPEQVVVSGQPSMALTTLVKGLQVAVLTAWQTSVDVTEAGGQVS